MPDRCMVDLLHMVSLISGSIRFLMRFAAVFVLDSLSASLYISGAVPAKSPVLG